GGRQELRGGGLSSKNPAWTNFGFTARTNFYILYAVQSDLVAEEGFSVSHGGQALVCSGQGWFHMMCQWTLLAEKLPVSLVTVWEHLNHPYLPVGSIHPADGTENTLREHEHLR
ncbi:hypothetical protein KUCAC02_025785, partial [Chaenocephalus aceratus]